MKFFKKRLDAESKTLFKNSTWVFFSNFFSTALAFLRSVVIARGLGAEIYGTYAIVVAFVALIQEFLNPNIGTALIKFGAVYQGEQRTDKLMAMVKSSLVASFVMALVSVVVVALLSFISYSAFFEKPGLEWFIVAYAIAASITYVNSISRGLLRLYYKFKLSSVIQMIMDVLETGMIAVAVFFYPKDLNVFFVAVILTRFLNGLICNALAFWELRKELMPHHAVSTSIVSEDQRSFSRFVVGNSIGNSLKTVISQGDVLLLGALSNAEQVGFYSVAKKVAFSVFTLSDPLVQSIYPQLSKLLAEKRFPEIRRMLLKITSLAMIPSLLFLIVAFFFNEWIIVTVYGSEYSPAALPFYYFLIGAVLGASTFWVLPLVQSLGLVRMRVKVYVFTILIGSVSAWLLVPTWHAAGMSLALLITNVMNLFIFTYEAIKKMKKEEALHLREAVSASP
ncbi:MAG TPA: oligosaccharide flippase family protein [Bacteroidia bacterium]|nr:oligosaccharide flippase family protein [Bacteroidia bacterium]